MMARSANAPLKGRIQKRKTNNLQIITSGLQRTAGPYRCANRVSEPVPYVSIGAKVRGAKSSMRWFAASERVFDLAMDASHLQP
jgi:hypothetical protein